MRNKEDKIVDVILNVWDEIGPDGRIDAMAQVVNPFEAETIAEEWTILSLNDVDKWIKCQKPELNDKTLRTWIQEVLQRNKFASK